MFRTTSLRLPVLYTTLFALSVVVLGVVTLYSTRAALSEQFDARIQAEAQALAQEYRTEGLGGVLQAVRERDHAPGALDYGLQDANGSLLAGRLAGVRTAPGWSVFAKPQRGEASEPVRVLTVELPGGLRLLVGDDLERITVLDSLVLRGFASAFVGVVVLGVAGGYALSRDVHRRLAAISGTAEAIIDGDLTRRVPVRGSSDDLDRLATTFNRMLDRISALMDSLRQVSNDIAHDLRTPLTRLRQRLEASVGPDTGHDRDGAVEATLADLDAILDTFAALLRIAQIDAGTRRAGFRSIDLTTLATTAVDALAPSAEEGGRRLLLHAPVRALIDGDAELLTQMLINLVENALRHTPAGTLVEVAVVDTGPTAELIVTDDGPGVPTQEREHIFDRFYRLETSRSTPGSGLGLALAAAVARLHDGRIELTDAGPGLRARVVFPRPG